MKYFYDFLKSLKTYINSGVIIFIFRYSYTSTESRLYSISKQICKRPLNYSSSSITKFEYLYFIISVLINTNDSHTITYLSFFQACLLKHSQDSFLKSRSFQEHSLEQEYTLMQQVKLSLRYQLKLEKYVSGNLLFFQAFQLDLPHLLPDRLLGSKALALFYHLTKLLEKYHKQALWIHCQRQKINEVMTFAQ